MLGETPQIFPAASDYHLLCLQHDDSAEMIIDGILCGLMYPHVQARCYMLYYPVLVHIPARQLELIYTVVLWHGATSTRPTLPHYLRTTS